MFDPRHILHICSGIGLTLAIMGCGGGKTPDDNGAIAAYKERQLTKEMLANYLPKGLSPEDSSRVSKAFVQQWLEEQAIMDEALSTYKDLAEEVEHKVQDYKAKLIMHGYENRLIEESLDKNVSKKEIVAFYEANKDNFISSEKLYNYFYIVTNKSDVALVADWMRSGNPQDIVKLKEWAKENAIESKVDSNYVNESKIEFVSKGYYGNLQKTAPGKLIRWNGVIRGEKRYYLFKMIQVVEAGEPLTIELCRDKIVDLILNERKVSLIEKNEEKILKNARTNNYIHEY
ncbi:MAG: peptidyl-prolyl cis-trans isomerase [Bacteroidetes bacterium]|nr:peptidyl-prolyl cis-trans isomerase [Bacteroidota bacterium]MBL0017734.1 peptidyl-prolyl cis-trans isomerase [Bacteroidota bacterium]MBP6639005.1 peptidyl-prolyl cis-trans isomerase [Bacteroidia bacterium]